MGPQDILENYVIDKKIQCLKRKLELSRGKTFEDFFSKILKNIYGETIRVNYLES